MCVCVALHLEHHEIELGGILAVVVVDGRRLVSHQHGHGVIPLHQLLHDGSHVQPMAVISWENQDVATHGRTVSMEERK